MRLPGWNLRRAVPRDEKSPSEYASSPNAQDERAYAVIATMFVDDAAGKTICRLRSAGVRAILLKGASFRRMLYGDGEPRCYHDCDILVAPQDIDRAEAILVEMGLRSRRGDLAEARPWHARTWFATHHPSVDLHRTLSGVGVAPIELWSLLSERTETASVGGVEVEVLEPAARVMHVALNSTQHGDRTGQHSSRSLRDLARAVATVPIDVWRDAAELASRLHATELFAAGLRLDPRGAALAERLGLPSARSVEVILRATASPPEALALEWLMRVPGLRRKLRIVLRKAFPPRDLMGEWSPMARPDRAGLACAYVLRPFSLIARLPRAVVALRAARRAAARADRPRTRGMDATS